MKHPLLIAMLTPQAAPETRGLRIMRLVWMALCASLAGAVLGLQALLALLGPKGPGSAVPRRADPWPVLLPRQDPRGRGL